MLNHQGSSAQPTSPKDKPYLAQWTSASHPKKKRKTGTKYNPKKETKARKREGTEVGGGDQPLTAVSRVDLEDIEPMGHGGAHGSAGDPQARVPRKNLDPKNWNPRSKLTAQTPFSPSDLRDGKGERC